jgi:enoyl-CoA hydratase/carnithine racemase
MTVINRKATVELNRPERLNAASPELVADFKELLQEATVLADVVIILGAGRAFCAGHDLKGDPLAPGSAEATVHLKNIQDITRILRSPKIISIAAVHGHALGAGLEFALSCDFVVADPNTSFGFPEVSVGLSVTGGISYLLPQAIGLPKAKELVLLGDRFTADAALNLGLITQVSPPGEAPMAADALAARLLNLPLGALSMAKAAFEDAYSLQVERAMEREVNNAQTTIDSMDAETARHNFAAEAGK